MVKVQHFAGAVFHPQDYSHFLYSNIEHLEPTPMASTFNASEMISRGKLLPETQPCSYIYRQQYKNHLSFGIVAEISVEDYHQGKIKKHEKTLKRPGMNHQSYKKQHVGPVVVSHPRHEDLENSITTVIQQVPPFSQWTTKDGRHHSLWKVASHQIDLTEKFSSIDSLYILDGHHRLEAAHQNYLCSAQPRPWDHWIQAIIYSSHSIKVEPFHRVIKHQAHNPKMIQNLFQVQNIQITQLFCSQLMNFNLKKELETYDVILKVGEQMFGIHFKRDSRNILEKVASFRLQQEILATILTKEEEKNITYVPGIVDQAELLSHQFVFFVKGPSIQTVFQIADQQISMPPKSTWMQPKPCSHMVIRLAQ